MLYSSYYNKYFNDVDEVKAFAKVKLIEKLATEYNMEKLIFRESSWGHAGTKYSYVKEIFSDVYRLKLICYYGKKLFNKTKNEENPHFL